MKNIEERDMIIGKVYISPNDVNVRVRLIEKTDTEIIFDLVSERGYENVHRHNGHLIFSYVPYFDGWREHVFKFGRK